MKQILTISTYLAVKEIWRNRGRFLLVSLVIALITLLVLFIAALGEGLGNGNREYISKLNADLVVFQGKSDFLIQASRLGRDRLAAVRRVDGVQDAGMFGASSVNLIQADDNSTLKVAMLGVEPGHTGEPRVLEGSQLSTDLAEEVLIDANTAIRTGITVGDTLTVRVTQGTRDELFKLRVVGVTDGQQYSLQPSVFVPFFTWDRIRPKSEAEVNSLTSVANVFLVKLDDPAQVHLVAPDLVRIHNDLDVLLPQTLQLHRGHTGRSTRRARPAAPAPRGRQDGPDRAGQAPRPHQPAARLAGAQGEDRYPGRRHPDQALRAAQAGRQTAER